MPSCPQNVGCMDEHSLGPPRTLSLPRAWLGFAASLARRGKGLKGQWFSFPAGASRGLIKARAQRVGGTENTHFCDAAGLGPWFENH